MSSIHSRNTSPELAVARVLRKEKIRFRRYDEKLPGRPDFVLRDSNLVFLVHGCFWHHHEGCGRANMPKSNKSYWIPKIQRNQERGREVLRLLRKKGCRPRIIWECQTKTEKEILCKVRRFVRDEKLRNGA